MMPFSLLSGLLPKPRRPFRRTPPRPRLELLEDRLAPAYLSIVSSDFGASSTGSGTANGAPYVANVPETRTPNGAHSVSSAAGLKAIADSHLGDQVFNATVDTRLQLSESPFPRSIAANLFAHAEFTLRVEADAGDQAGDIVDLFRSYTVGGPYRAPGSGGEVQDGRSRLSLTVNGLAPVTFDLGPGQGAMSPGGEAEKVQVKVGDTITVRLSSGLRATATANSVDILGFSHLSLRLPKPTIRVTAAYDDHGTRRDRVFGTYLSGVSLQNTFDVTVGNPDAVSNVAVTLRGQTLTPVAYLGGDTTRYRYDMGTLPPGDHALVVTANDRTSGPLSFNGTVKVKNLDGAGLKVVPAADTGSAGEVAQLRLLAGQVLPLRFDLTLSGLPLESVYKDRLAVTFAEADSGKRFQPEMPPGGFRNGTTSFVVLSSIFGDRVVDPAAADYRAFLVPKKSHVPGGANQLRHLADFDGVRVVAVPRWLRDLPSSFGRTEQSEALFGAGSAAYAFKVTLGTGWKVDLGDALSELTEGLADAGYSISLPQGQGLSNSVGADLGLTVYASPFLARGGVPQNARVRADRITARVELFGETKVTRSLKPEGFQVIGTLNNLTLDRPESLTIATLPGGVDLRPLLGGDTTYELRFGSRDGQNKWQVSVPVFTLGPISLNGTVFFGGIFRASLDRLALEGTLKLDFSTDLEERIIINGASSSLSLTARAKASLDLEAGLAADVRVFGKELFTLAEAKATGGASLDLDAKISLLVGPFGLSLDRDDSHANLDFKYHFNGVDFSIFTPEEDPPAIISPPPSKTTGPLAFLTNIPAGGPSGLGAAAMSSQGFAESADLAAQSFAAGGDFTASDEPAGVVAALSDGTLTITGDDAADDAVTLRVSPDDATQLEVLAGAAVIGAYRRDEVTAIAVNLGGGNDTLRVSSFGGNPVPAGGLTFVGGAGSDTLAGPAVSTTWDLTGLDAGITDGGLSFTEVENLAGGGAADTFLLRDGAGLSGTLGGGLGADTLDLSAFTGPTTWTVTALNAGSVDGVLTFVDIDNLTGTAGDDAFVFADGARVTGTVDGGEGTDTLDRSASSAATFWEIAAAGGGEIDGIWAFAHLESLVGGSGDDTFAALAGASGLAVQGGAGLNALDLSAFGTDLVWDLGADGGGTVDAGLSFTSLQALTGGSGRDTFRLAHGFTAPLALDGNAGRDALDLSDFFSDVTWALTAPGEGAANTILFAEFEDLQSGYGNDVFRFADGAGVTGSLAGGEGIDTLDYTAYTAEILVDLAALSATGSAGFADIEGVVGGQAFDTLAGANESNRWTVSGQDAGNVNGFSFQGVERLAGGTGEDVFSLNPDGGSIGNLAGGLGNDSLSYAGWFQDAEVDLARSTASGVGNFSGMESLVGGFGNDLLVGPDAGGVWSIRGTNLGEVNSVQFTAFERLTGGDGADSFLMGAAGSLTGSLDGGAGTNTLDYAAYSTGVTVDLQTGAATAIGDGVFNIQNVAGTAGDDLLVGNDLDNVLRGNGGQDDLIGGAGRHTFVLAATQSDGTTTSGGSGGTFTFHVTLFEAGSGPLSLSAPVLPPWLTWTDNGDGTATLAGTPAFADVGTHEVTLVASDGGGAIAAEQNFTVTVVDRNSPPVFGSTAATGAFEDNLYAYSIAATDADAGTELAFTAPTKPGWLTLIDHGDGTATLTGTPSAEDVGTHQIVLDVFDGREHVQQAFTLTVANTNDAPAGTPQTVAILVNSTHTFTPGDFGFVDLDVPGNGLLGVKLASLPTTGSLTLDGSAVAAGQFIAAADLGKLAYTAPAGSGTDPFTFQVQDDGGTAQGGVDLDPVGSSRVDLQACKLEYSIVSPK